MNGVAAALLKIGLIAVIIAIHGYFVVSEYALVTVRRTRVEQLAAEGSRAARRVLDTLARLRDLIAAVQLGVTMASLALGALAEPTVADLLEPAFAFIPHGWRPVTAHGVAIAVTFILITALDIVLAELVPKTVALQNSEQVAFVIVRPIRAFMWLFSPFISLLNWAGDWVLRLSGLGRLGERHDVHSTEELKMLVAASARAGVLDRGEQEMLFRVFEFSEMTARQVMVPRTEVVGIEIGTGRNQVYELVRTTHHTRYPVYRGTLDDVVGVLYVRDLLNRWAAPFPGSFELATLMREPLFIPDSVAIDDLLARMRDHRVQIAIVHDEYGGTAGIVTMEDILERIVGEVRDEFEQVGEEVQVLPEGDAVIDGLVLVADVNEWFNLDLNEEEYDTLGGLVWGELGRRPEVGDEVCRDGWCLRVEQMDGLRVARVRLIRLSDGSEPAAPTNGGQPGDGG